MACRSQKKGGTGASDDGDRVVMQGWSKMCRRADANPGACVGVRASRIPEGIIDRLPVSVRHCQLIPGEGKAQQEMQTFFRRVLMLYTHSFNRWSFSSPPSFDCYALLLALNVFRVLLFFRASSSSCSSVYSTRRCVMNAIATYGKQYGSNVVLQTRRTKLQIQVGPN